MSLRYELVAVSLAAATIVAACGGDVEVSVPADGGVAATPDPADESRAEAALLTAADLGGTWVEVPVEEADPEEDRRTAEVLDSLAACDQVVALDPDPSDGLDFGPDAPVRAERDFEDDPNELSQTVSIWPTTEEAGRPFALAEEAGLTDCLAEAIPELLRRAAIDDPEAPDLELGEVSVDRRDLDVGDESFVADLTIEFEVQGQTGVVESTLVAARVDRVVVSLQFGDILATSTLDPDAITRLAVERAREAMGG